MEETNAAPIDKGNTLHHFLSQSEHFLRKHRQLQRSNALQQAKRADKITRSCVITFTF